MVSKYDQGESHLQKCPTCEYEEELKTSGVHVSEGGAVSVYAADDEFSCPNCSSGKNDQAETWYVNICRHNNNVSYQYVLGYCNFYRYTPVKEPPFFGPLP